MTAQPITTISTSPTLVPAVIPYGRAKGRTTNTTLFDVSTGSYHCADCDYVAENYGKVFAHRRQHAAPKPPRAKAKPAPQVDKIADAVALLTDALADAQPKDDDRVSAEWKTRALAAERSLKSLRRILGASAS